MYNDHNGYHYCSNLCPQFWIYTAAATIIILLCVYIMQCHNVNNYACFRGMRDYRLPKSRIVNRSNTMDMPVRNNRSYVTALSQQSTTNTSGAAPQDQAPKAGSADATIINQGEAHHDGPEYSCLGPQYETIDSSRRESQSQKNQKARSRLLSERYEYSETHCMAAADGGTATVENASYAEIPMNFKQEQYSTENANYSHLKH